MKDIDEYQLLNEKLKKDELLTEDELEFYYDYIESDLSIEVEEQKSFLFNVKGKLKLVSMIDLLTLRYDDQRKELDNKYENRFADTLCNFENVLDFVYACGDTFTNEDIRICVDALNYCNAFADEVTKSTIKYLNRGNKSNFTSFVVDSIELDERLKALDEGNKVTYNKVASKIKGKQLTR